MPLPAETKPGLSVFFPAYNDSGTIASLVITALQTARTPDPRLRSHHRQRRQRRCDGGHRRRARPHLSRGAGRPPRAEPRLRRRAAERASKQPRAIWSSTPTAMPSTIRRRWRVLWDAFNDERRSRQRLQDQPVRSAAPHRHRTHLSPHGQAAVRPEGARRRLRLPADAPIDLRPRDAREEQRRDLPGDDEEDPGRRIPDRRSAGPSLPPRVRKSQFFNFRRLFKTGVDVFKLWFALVDPA